MTLSEMRSILDSTGIRLTKSLGQNFLHDRNQLDRIVAAAQLRPTDRILEIGPGLGPLTEKLLPLAAEVLAIEKDHRLARLLDSRLGIHPNLTLRCADALDVLRQTPSDWSSWKLVANLPYSVASPILVELAACPHPPEAMVVTLQLEVARRLQASAADADYGLLTVLVQLTFEPGKMFRIARGCFHPEPDVDSGCIALRRRAPAPAPPEKLQAARELARIAFSQRRKMMHKLLAPHYPAAALESAFAAVGLERTVRAEQVAPHRFLQLAAALAVPPCP